MLAKYAFNKIIKYKKVIFLILANAQAHVEQFT